MTFNKQAAAEIFKLLYLSMRKNKLRTSKKVYDLQLLCKYYYIQNYAEG